MIRRGSGEGAPSVQVPFTDYKYVDLDSKLLSKLVAMNLRVIYDVFLKVLSNDDS